jgi:hypothetical protein
MSDPELDERHARGVTENRPIPNAPAQQEIQPDLSTSVFSYGSEVRCSEQGQESSLRSLSTSFVPSPKVRARNDIDLKNHTCTPENAKSYTHAISTSPNSKPTVDQSPGEADARDAQKMSGDEKKLTIPTQEVDPDTSFVVVTGKLISEREFSNGCLSGYVNLFTEDESSLSTTNSEDTLSSGACSTNAVVEDKAEIHRDPITDYIGEDDGLPFNMDDINEGAPSSINVQNGDQAIQSTEPAGLFTGSLPLSFGNMNDSNVRPALTPSNVTANHARDNTQQSGSDSSATPTPAQRSPSTSNASETSTASSHSSVPSHTEGMHRINNAFPYFYKFYCTICRYPS